MTTNTRLHTPMQLDKIIYTHQFDNPILAVQTEKEWTLCGVTYQALPCGCEATGGGVLPSPLTVTLCATHLRCVNEREALLDTLSLLVRTIGDCMRHDYTNTEVASLQIVWSVAKQVLARAEREG